MTKTKEWEVDWLCGWWWRDSRLVWKMSTRVTILSLNLQDFSLCVWISRCLFACRLLFMVGSGSLRCERSEKSSPNSWALVGPHRLLLSVIESADKAEWIIFRGSSETQSTSMVSRQLDMMGNYTAVLVLPDKACVGQLSTIMLPLRAWAALQGELETSRFFS